MSLRTVAPFSRQLLRCHVRGRPAHLRRLRFVCRGNRQTEIGNPYAPAAVDHHIRRLEVAVEHASFVRGGETRHQLLCDVKRLLVGEVADAGQQRRQVLAVDVFHRQEVLPVHLGDVVHAADVRVRKLTGDADFREEALAANGIVRKCPRQEFQGDRLAELQIIGAVHLPHPAATEQADDAIAVGKDYAGSEAADGVPSGCPRQTEPALRRNHRVARWALHENGPHCTV